jgi:hypothetical protein
LSLIKELKTIGQYYFDKDLKLHTIRISPIEHEAENKEMLICALISTTLHELKHSIQKEENGFTFRKYSYVYNDNFDNIELSEYLRKMRKRCETF